MSRKSRFLARRREAGLCLTCGKVPENSRVYCGECLAKRRQVGAERRANGLCYCGRPAVAGTVRCPPCTQSVRNAHKKVRNTRKSRGLCDKCGAIPEPGRSRCGACQAEIAERERRRIEAGICRCGRPFEGGKKRCSVCNERVLAKIRTLRASVVRGYGDQCICCGDNDPNVLELDHVKGDGNEQRRKLTPQGIYRWAVKNNFPASLQLLCANCHTAKTRTGDCSYRAGLWQRSTWD